MLKYRLRTGVYPRTVLPGIGRIHQGVTLSKAAKLRLSRIDYYQAHNNNAGLTCRHFGIARSCFYKWLNRFRAQGLAGLESQSQRPKTVRQPLTPLPVVDLIRRLRKANPEYSKYKLAVILRRDFGYSLSASTIGRIISRHQLFFTPPVKPKNHPNRRKSIERIRKPKDLRPSRPGELLEVDVKYLPNIGKTRYGFVAIDVFSRLATVHVASSLSSRQAAVAWAKTVEALGLPVAALNDNGSENLGAFAQLLKEQAVTQYFTRSHTPKDKPYVERFIGSLEKECLQWGGVAIDLADQQQLIDSWLTKYHDYRPHQALDYLTPKQYQAKLSVEVSSMY